LVLEHELIYRDGRLEERCVPRIVGVTEELRFCHQAESCSFQFVANHALFDPMQGVGLRRTGPRIAGMIGNDEVTARP